MMGEQYYPQVFVLRVINGSSKRTNENGYHQSVALRIREGGVKKVSEEFQLPVQEYDLITRRIKNLPFHTSYRNGEGTNYFLKCGGKFTLNPENETIVVRNVDERIFRGVFKIK